MKSRTQRRFWHEFNRLQLTSNVSLEKSFNCGFATRFIHQCSSSRLSEMSGQCESEITIALLRKDTAISRSGFGLARTRNTTISSDNWARTDIFQNVTEL